jgi:MFS family permease
MSILGPSLPRVLHPNNNSNGNGHPNNISEQQQLHTPQSSSPQQTNSAYYLSTTIVSPTLSLTNHSNSPYRHHHHPTTPNSSSSKQVQLSSTTEVDPLILNTSTTTTTTTNKKIFPSSPITSSSLDSSSVIQFSTTTTRNIVLFTACCIPFGAHFTKQFLPTLKPFFTSTTSTSSSSMTSFEFGTLLSAIAWPNLFILPFAASLFVDSHGADRGAVIMTIFALIGHVLFCASLGDGSRIHLHWSGAIVGRMLFGLGLGGSGVVSGAILGEWWGGGQHLSFAMGMTESSQHTASFLGKLVPNFLIGNDVSPMRPLWFASFSLLLSCGAALIYLLLEESSNEFTFAFAKTTPPTRMISLTMNEDEEILTYQEGPLVAAGSQQQQQSQPDPEIIPKPTTLDSNNQLDDNESTMDEKNNDSDDNSTVQTKSVIAINETSYFRLQKDSIRTLPLIFWLVGLMHMMFSNTANLFGGFATDYMVQEFEITPQVAALYASIDALVPIFLSPIMGMIIDRFGYRLHLCAISACISGCAFWLLWLGYQPLLPMLLLALSCSTTPTLIKSIIPTIIPCQIAGQAFAIFYCFESLAQGIGHMILGRIRDQTENYNVCLLVLCWICFMAFCICGLVYWEDQRSCNGKLSSSYYYHNYNIKGNSGIFSGNNR